MTARSQNGWMANTRAVIASYRLPGGKVALRAGDVSVVLLWVATEFHARVEPLTWPGVWGYAERPIRGSSTLSNHASGTAIDLNAPRHPLGQRATFSSAQVRVIRDILAHCEGAIRWGGDYRSRADEMHFEVVAGSAAVARIAEKIRGDRSTPPPPTKPRRGREDDCMYIKTQPDKSKPEVWTALLSGPMFVGLGESEAPSDERIREMGAVVQWVELNTWIDLDRRSHALCANPRQVVSATPTRATS